VPRKKLTTGITAEKAAPKFVRDLIGPLTQDQREFLECYLQTRSLMKAYEQSDLSTFQHFEWLRNDDAYRRAFDECSQQFNLSLEDAAYRRAVIGVEEPVFNPKTGEEVLVRKYADGLLTTLLKANLPDKYDRPSRKEITGKNGGPIQHVEADLSKLSDDDLEALERILSKADEPSGSPGGKT
jgi:hypothetical protein